MTEVGFEYVGHLVTVPVRVGDLETRIIADSGIGLTIIRSSLAEQVGFRPTGASFTGRRMSGQEVTLPLAIAPSLRLGTLMRTELSG